MYHQCGCTHWPLYILSLIFILNLAFMHHHSTLNAAEIEPNVQSHFQAKLKALIHNFTYVMHLPTDSELHHETISDFKSTLVQLNRELNATDFPLYFDLLHQALYGVFKVRSHAVKDDLVSGRSVTIHQHQFDSLTPWKLDLLELILLSKSGTKMDSFRASDNGGALVELSVKLQLLSVTKLLVSRGFSVCYSFSPLNCTTAIQHAVISKSTHSIDFLVKTFLKELQAFSHGPVNTTEALLSFFSHSGSMQYSAMDIACMHCLSGVSCQALSHLMLYISNCNFVCTPKNLLPLTFQPISKHTFQRTSTSEVYHRHLMRNEISPRELLASGYTGFSRLASGWAVYDGFRIGDEGCDLPRIKAEDLDRQLFEELFVNLSIPVVIEGMTKDWKLRETWRKRNLLKKWSHLDLLVGPIPYGEVFGELHGYATVDEFLSYMEGYGREPVIANMERFGSEYPLYVFDNKVLLHHFMEDYNITFFTDIQTWRSANLVYQFILGPVGSGAPFHFHCNAVNALIHGRKKWFLYLPGSAIYSKVHPLKWYQEHGSRMTTDKPIECNQHAGDVIYVPSHWTHATINMDECIGLAVEFDSGKC